MMLAEGSLPEEHIDAFDMTYGWNTYDVLYPVMLGSLSVDALDGTLKGEYYQFPQGALRLRFSSNHDKNVYDAPAVERYTVDGAKAAAILMATLPGVPLIYNGDEVGNAKRLDLFEKRAIEWDKDTNGFRALYTSLNKLRATMPVLRSGGMKRIANTKIDSSAVYAFERVLGRDRATVVINLSPKPQSFHLPADISKGLQIRLARCGINNTDKGLVLALPGYGYFLGARKPR
jgi:glycosidase